ncbi:MAG: bifunctional methylenetetrahydrofolate dehydrogenase/methenyltetrahydrofolate cyclohydrolase [Candidatus Magasanikbacteria bacterium CG10_big_fil_rev_8_21_14_0_10_36_32]|uniref:Bifunctional protein FolD n=1 Tax=Candidatus Magasanikbacteria bacterium CG10_big_fil_rev_8_21_14_0_10_36_32 TaxID=1974646 RepID=A0A2M6W6G3_9BACT|nr:MAG: bifunctional methylenetetrahydrofolate dehydrogenase/methenyltetrahydrofolate cyclohydrolase [Candidatus Magasanikbacteria bacterium CG10_big_fil_rev_8_21_14_0_10_36_32]
MLIDGKAIAFKINQETLDKVKKMNHNWFNPKVAVVLIGNRPESEVYVRQKEMMAKKLGFGFELLRFPSKIKEEDLIREIMAAQSRRDTAGIIIQLPLPKQFDQQKILSYILPEADIDCLTEINLGRLLLKDNRLEPPTAGAVMEILRDLNVDFPGKNVVIIGSGLLLGRPLAVLLMNARATVTICNSTTKNLTKKCLEADIIISGAGKKNLVTAKMVKKGTIVIDAGFSFDKGKVFGDVNVSGLDKKGVLVTPTPGGVGPITVAKLFQNAAICAERKMTGNV